MNNDSAIMTMKGKVVFVTGASSGLGAHFARVLAQAGANVAVGARRLDKLDLLVDELKQETGAVAMAVALDVSDGSSVDAALDAIEAELGTVTVLINNAGVADPRSCLKVDNDSWDYVMNTNLKGAWRMAKAMAERCIAAGCSGSIVNIASILGLRVTFGESTYATSKAALIQLTKSMALELGRKGVRSNALCPGYFHTEMTAEYFDTKAGQDYMKSMPSGRLGELHELSAPLLLLASDSGSFINGIALPVDGGHLVSAL